MTLARAKIRPASTGGEPDSAWSPARDPAMAGLLDHLAEELAREYVRLMEEAAKNEGERDCEPE